MNRNKKRQNGRGLRGFTLVEIMIVVLIIGVLLNIATPGLLRAREGSRSKACQANMQKLQGAKEQWGLDTNADKAASPFWSDLVGSTKYLKSRPACPNAGTYIIRALDTAPTCNIGGNSSSEAFDDHILP